MWIDFLHALRVLARQRALTATVVLSLSVGLGANTATFSVLRGVLLKALPYVEPDRIVDLRVGTHSSTPDVMFGWHFQRWRGSTRLMQSMAGYNLRSMPLTGHAGAELISVAEVTADFFRVLGTSPSQGSGFRAEHQLPGTRVVVLSYRLWERRYGADPQVLGGIVSLDGEPYSVIGIMPRQFSFPSSTECWTALTMTEDGLRVERHAGGFFASRPARLRGIGRLAARATVDEVEREGLQLLTDQAVPVTVNVTTLQETLVGPVRSLLLMLQAGVLLLWAMVCANVTSLLAARGETRRHELATRASLGAGRWQLVRSALTESAVLACGGALSGLAIAHWLTLAFKTLAPSAVPRLDEIDLDAGVLLFSGALFAVTALVCGALPAWRALHSGTYALTLRADSRGAGANNGGGWTSQILVIAQVAASLILLTGALVLLDAVWRLIRVDPGFSGRDVLTARLTIPATAYASTAQRLSVLQQLLDQLRAAPGVDAVAIANDLPFAGVDPSILFSPVLTASSAHRAQASARWRIVSGDFFSSLGLRLVDGRGLDSKDTASALPVVVVNDALARRYFERGQAVGRTLLLENDVHRQIVGIVADAKETSVMDPSVPTIYHSVSQLALYGPRAALPLIWLERPYVLLTSRLSVASLANSLKQVVARIDRNLVVGDVQTMRRRLSDSMGSLTFAAALLSVLALIVVLTAIAGLYGLLSYWVARRTPELGVRLALGASPGHLLRIVLRDGLAMISLGIAVGLIVAWQMWRALPALAAGVSEPQPRSIIAASALLVLAGLVAAWGPARRAARVDPLEALRME